MDKDIYKKEPNKTIEIKGRIKSIKRREEEESEQEENKRRRRIRGEEGEH